MDQRDYHALMAHTTSGPAPGAMTLAPHPPVPEAPHAPQIHDARTIGAAIAHEVRQNLAQQQQQPAPAPYGHYAPPPSAAPYPQHAPSPHHVPYPYEPHHGHSARQDAQYGARPSRERDREHHLAQRKFRHFPVGFVEQQIAPGALAEIEVKPQVRFQGHRLAVGQSCARYFNIVDIKVGKDSQLAATGELPAEAFSSISVGTQMELDPADPGIVIVLIVRNTDTNPQDFGAALYGTVEES